VEEEREVDDEVSRHEGFRLRQEQTMTTNEAATWTNFFGPGPISPSEVILLGVGLWKLHGPLGPAEENGATSPAIESPPAPPESQTRRTDIAVGYLSQPTLFSPSPLSFLPFDLRLPTPSHRHPYQNQARFCQHGNYLAKS
jgi:hypothetical protein